MFWAAYSLALICFILAVIVTIWFLIPSWFLFGVALYLSFKRDSDT
jgi:hypothetical protein